MGSARESPWARRSEHLTTIASARTMEQTKKCFPFRVSAVRCRSRQWREMAVEDRPGNWFLRATARVGDIFSFPAARTLSRSSSRFVQIVLGRDRDRLSGCLRAR